MPALPPDRPGAPPPAPGDPAASDPAASDPVPGDPVPGDPVPGDPVPGDPVPGESGPAELGPAGPRCPRPPAVPRRPAGPRPLPDPAAVRLCLIPDSAPPYDAEVAAARWPGASGRAGAGPSAAPGAPPSSGTSSPSTPASPARPDSRPSPVPPGSGGLPSSPAPSAAWPSQFAQVLAETLAGSRSPRQLAPWTTERARERIQRLGPQLSAGQQPRVRRVMTFHPTADVMEMTVVVGFGKRVHALAVRLERAGHGPAARAGRWLCTTVEAA